MINRITGFSVNLHNNQYLGNDGASLMTSPGASIPFTPYSAREKESLHCSRLDQIKEKQDNNSIEIKKYINDIEKQILEFTNKSMSEQEFYTNLKANFHKLISFEQGQYDLDNLDSKLELTVDKELEQVTLKYTKSRNAKPIYIFMEKTEDSVVVNLDLPT